MSNTVKLRYLRADNFLKPINPSAKLDVTRTQLKNKILLHFGYFDLLFAIVFSYLALTWKTQL